MAVDNLLKQISEIKVDLTEKKVLERLLDRFRWPIQYPWKQPTIEAINADGSKDQNFYDQDGYLNSEQCIQRYEEGYTLILSGIGGFCKDTWLIEKLLNNIYNTQINCNFYFGNGLKSISFKKHSHDYAVLVKNIYGCSKWIIDGKEVFLKEQDIIWFDKNISHEVVEISSAKLSMTCNIK